MSVDVLLEIFGCRSLRFNSEAQPIVISHFPAPGRAQSAVGMVEAVLPYSFTLFSADTVNARRVIRPHQLAPVRIIGLAFEVDAEQLELPVWLDRQDRELGHDESLVNENIEVQRLNQPRACEFPVILHTCRERA